MSLLTKQPPIDPQDVPLNSLVAQEQVDVNFISRNNFNNNAYRSNFGSNNSRPFPSNNYGNNTYPSTKNVGVQGRKHKFFITYETHTQDLWYGDASNGQKQITYQYLVR